MRSRPAVNVTTVGIWLHCCAARDPFAPQHARNIVDEFAYSLRIAGSLGRRPLLELYIDAHHRKRAALPAFQLLDDVGRDRNKICPLYARAPSGNALASRAAVGDDALESHGYTPNQLR